MMTESYRKYFDTDDANPIGVNISTIGHYIHPPRFAYPDKNHPETHIFNWDNGRYLNDFQLLFIANGSGTFEAEGMSPIVINKDTVILLFPNTWHRYHPNKETGWEEFWVGFSGEYPKYLLEKKCFNPNQTIINIGFNNEVIAAFNDLIQISKSNNEDLQKMMSFVFISILGIVYKSTLEQHNKISRKELLVQNTINYINKHWNEKIDFESLASNQGVSYSLLRKTFKDQSSTTLKQYQIDIKIRKSEQLIINSDLYLSEISYQCGFENIQTFSRMFKNKLGISPSDLRA